MRKVFLQRELVDGRGLVVEKIGGKVHFAKNESLIVDGWWINGIDLS
jgi:hypothetical protein